MFAELHIERGRIRAVVPCATGTVIRTETDSYSYPGCHVLPGFVDSHAHIVGLGERLTLPSLHAATDEADAIRILSEATPGTGGWIRAMGWNHERWPGSQWPHRSNLDAQFPSTPVCAMRIDGHAAWVNSAALQAANIDPSGHTGLLVDDEMEPVLAVVPEPSTDDLQRMILAATRLCAAHGITEIHDMDVAHSWLEAFRLLAENGTLPVRVQSFVRAQHDEWITLGQLPAGGEFHRLVGVKLFADGALGSRGAFLRAPFHDDPSTCGIELLTVDRLVKACRAAIDAGWQCIAVHAIGDAAVRNVLDAYTVVRSWSDGADMILRIEHAQHVAPDDVVRMADLRVFACVQPSHCMSDAVMAEHRLGPDRLPWSYRWRSLIDAGITVTGGSDFPIEDPDVLYGLTSFAHRTPPGASAPWMPDERISIGEALAAYTTDAHRAADVDYRRGRIDVGMDADVVIIDRDLATCSAEELQQARIMATFTAGRRRYSA